VHLRVAEKPTFGEKSKPSAAQNGGEGWLGHIDQRDIIAGEGASGHDKPDKSGSVQQSADFVQRLTHESAGRRVPTARGWRVTAEEVADRSLEIGGVISEGGVANLDACRHGERNEVRQQTDLVAQASDSLHNDHGVASVLFTALDGMRLAIHGGRLSG